MSELLAFMDKHPVFTIILIVVVGVLVHDCLVALPVAVERVLDEDED